MVSRLREELDEERGTARALELTIGGSGRAQCAVRSEPELNQNTLIT